MTPTTKSKKQSGLNENPSSWRTATVTMIRQEAPNMRSFVFTFDQPVKHDAGQHYEIRLTSPDGYQAARLYSAASPANGTGNMLQLTIMLMPEGEVSPYLFHNVKTGDQLELRGPLGRYFVWTPEVTKPVLLVGGGVGVAPLRAIRLDHQQYCCESPLKLLYSVKSYDDMAFKYEMFPKTGAPSSDVTMTFTGHAPENWKGYKRRIDNEMLKEVISDFKTQPAAYVCGPTPMVEAVTQSLVALDLDPDSIKAERFGSTA